MLPRPPFVGWPVKKLDPRLGFAWFIAPNFFFSQLVLERASAADATMLHDWVDDALAVHSATIRPTGGLIAVHDLRSLVGYESGARAVTTERMRRRVPGAIQSVTIAVGPINPLVKMGAQAVALFATTVLQRRMTVVSDPGPVVTALGVRAIFAT